MAPIGVGSKITSAEFVELPGSVPYLVLTADNPDGTKGCSTAYYRRNSDEIKQLNIAKIRGSTITRCVVIDGNLVIVFACLDGEESVIVFYGVSGGVFEE